MACLKPVTADREGIKAAWSQTSKPRAHLGKRTAPEVLQPQREEARMEAEVCDRVDECQAVIRQRVDCFFTDCLAKVPLWVDSLLTGRNIINRTPFYDTVLPQQSLDSFVEELRLMIQRDVARHFGVASLATIRNVKLALRVDVKQLQSLFKEYHRTLLVTQLATEISNRACQQSVNSFKASVLFIKVLEKLEIGSALLKLANCCPRQNRVHYRQVMITQVDGMLQTIRNQLIAEACLQAASCFYELYDLLWELQCKREIAISNRLIRESVSRTRKSHN